MLNLTKDQALERYTIVTAEIRKLEGERSSLKSIIFAETFAPKEAPKHKVRPRGNQNEQKILSTMSQYGKALTLKELNTLLDGWNHHTLETVIRRLVTKGFLNKESVPGQQAHLYSLTVYKDNKTII